MARRSSVKYYPTRNAYYTFFRGKQHRLAVGPKDEPQGPTFLAALTAFKELMDIAQADTNGDCNTARTIFELYAQKLAQEERHSTLRIFLRVASLARTSFGDLRVEQIKPYHIEQFLYQLKQPRKASNRNLIFKWTNTHLPLRLLKVCFNWAVRQQLITKHCLNTIANESQGTRGEEAYCKKENFKIIIDNCHDELKQLLLLIFNTGCRPDEAYHLEARHYNATDKCFVFNWQAKKPEYVWKNAKKTKKDRIIYLNDEMVEMMEARIAKRPTGLLFTTTRKKFNKKGSLPWKTESVGDHLRRLCKKFFIAPKVTAYGLRHTYCTNYLLQGGSIKVLADLVGTSVGMIERHYSHIQVDRARMRSIMMMTMGNICSLKPEALPVATSAVTASPS